MRRHAALTGLVAALSVALGTSYANAAPEATPSAQRELAAAVGPVARADGNHVTVTVDDLTAKTEAAYDGRREFVTASIVKVDILCTLLYRSQETHRALTPEQKELATTMIEHSDNDSASSLYDDVGGAMGVDEANRVFGLSETTAGTGPYWGLTTTTTDDQIRLLRLVFTRPSVLTAASQDYAQYLMGHVETDQQWGVPVAADHGTHFVVKNGWLPDPYTGLWEINSIGEVEHHHQRLLIAILSDDNASEASGISVVEEIARKAAAAMSR
ncbi:MAG TPA: serine hydrolase [Streptosporangiaceae bacterium]